MAASRTEFHKLTVARVDSLTDDSAAVTFDVPDGLRGQFRFAPGQSSRSRRRPAHSPPTWTGPATTC
jgi:ring-1,2-phenylacetyl-CoA epoxidase subunit PaaE